MVLHNLLLDHDDWVPDAAELEDVLAEIRGDGDADVDARIAGQGRGRVDEAEGNGTQRRLLVEWFLRSAWNPARR